MTGESWTRLDLGGGTHFSDLLGPIEYRREGEAALVRWSPERQHANLLDAVHGGAMLGFIDQALFAAGRALGLIELGQVVTLELSTQFVGAARIGWSVEATLDLVRETGRFLFLRGIARQGDEAVASFSATLRKAVNRPGGGRGPASQS